MGDRQTDSQNDYRSPRCACAPSHVHVYMPSTSVQLLPPFRLTGVGICTVGSLRWEEAQSTRANNKCRLSSVGLGASRGVERSLTAVSTSAKLSLTTTLSKLTSRVNLTRSLLPLSVAITILYTMYCYFPRAWTVHGY